MIASILLPTRKRAKSLLRCIKSIEDSAEDKASFQFIVQMRKDDDETLDALPEILESAYDVQVIIGPPLEGYKNLNCFYGDAAKLATGYFVWLMGDDCVVKGDGWDTRLLKMTGAYIVQPETHRLNNSVYHNDPNCPFFLAGNNSWNMGFGPDAAVDKFLLESFRATGWPTSYLPGVEVWHDEPAISGHKRTD